MYQFQPGGTLSERAFYVEREADVELLEALISREYCYVLAPRQIGKSSLRARCQKRLESAGFICATIDLSSIGTDLSQDDWYASLLVEIADGLGLEDPSEYWRSCSGLPAVSRFVQYFSNILINQVKAESIVFVDEIDVLRKLPFPGDDFLAAIRSLFNRRADEPKYEQICFCLIGVAAPGELIEDTFKTPFNIGRHIQMMDFTPEQSLAFLPGLLPCVSGSAEKAEALISEIMTWTDGHPYMTQRLCSEVANEKASEHDPKAVIEQTVSKIFRDALSDPNLSYAATRITSKNSPVSTASKLSLYRRILLEERVDSNKNDRAQSELRLAGLVKDISTNGKNVLRIRNVIFRRVFDLAWLNEHSSYSSISDAHLRWVNALKSNGYLLHGQALDDALAWSEGKEISAGEQEYIRASLLQRQQEAKYRENEQLYKWKQSERQTRILRIGIALLSLLAVGLAASVFYGIQLTRKAERATETANQSLNQERVAKENAEKEKERARQAQLEAQRALKSEAKLREIAEAALASEKTATEEATGAKNRALESKDAAEAAQIQALEAALRAQEMQRRAESSAKITAAAEGREEEARSHAVDLADEIVTVLNSLLGIARPAQVDTSLRSLITKATNLLDILRKQRSESNGQRLLESHAYAHWMQGEAAIKDKNINQAREHYEEAVKSARKLINLDASSERSHRTIILAYSGLTSVARAQGNLQEELSLEYEILRVREELYLRNARSGERLYQYLLSLVKVAKLLKRASESLREQAIPRPAYRDPSYVINRLRTLVKRAVDAKQIPKDQIAFISKLTEQL